MWRQRRQCVHAGDTFLHLRFIAFFFFNSVLSGHNILLNIKEKQNKKISPACLFTHEFSHLLFTDVCDHLFIQTLDFLPVLFFFWDLSVLPSLCLSDDLSDLVQPPASLFLLIEERDDAVATVREGALYGPLDLWTERRPSSLRPAELVSVEGAAAS